LNAQGEGLFFDRWAGLWPAPRIDHPHKTFIASLIARVLSNGCRKQGQA
tara:strand:+ start:48849 stop:48995 length:147 start_codon:yes stop_codon:yes gene_type:complete